MMEKNKKNEIEAEMKDVIATSKKIRNFFMDDNTSDEEKEKYYKLYMAALKANCNIVSASVVRVTLEKIDK